jgi:threonine/homoserine/homoserine lactone efflux protein
MVLSGIMWASFLPAALLVSLVPGANQLLILRNAARQGMLDALAGLIGRYSAFGILTLVVAAGLGSVLTASAVAFNGVKWLGVAYLACLGTRMLISSRHRSEDLGQTPRQRRRSMAVQEFLIGITNPKALLLFAAFVPQFIVARHGATDELLVGGLACIAIDAVIAAAYALLGARLCRQSTRGMTSCRLETISGASFVILAVYVALARRP